MRAWGNNTTIHTYEVCSWCVRDQRECSAVCVCVCVRFWAVNPQPRTIHICQHLQMQPSSTHYTKKRNPPSTHTTTQHDPASAPTLLPMPCLGITPHNRTYNLIRLSMLPRLAGMVPLRPLRTLTRQHGGASVVVVWYTAMIHACSEC